MPPVLLYGIIACGLCTALHLIALKIFPKWKLLDTPEKYGLTRAPLPYPTGVLAILTFGIVFVLTQQMSPQALGLLFCILLLACVSILDDLYDLPITIRLGTQFLIGFLLFATGTRIYTITNPLGGIISLDLIDLPGGPFGPLPLWSGIFTVAWVMLTTNAFNWFDGIPGQVSVLSLLSSLTIGFLSLSERVNQPEIALIAFILAGCALASMLFDFPPNAVVMGDTGAMFFGLMLGTLSIYAGGKVATAFLVLGVPLIDAVLVLLRRIKNGKSPFCGDLDHLHHRLIFKGWSERQVITLTAALGAAFGITALFLSTFEKFIAIILLILVMMGLTWYSRDKRSSAVAQ